MWKKSLGKDKGVNGTVPQQPVRSGKNHVNRATVINLHLFITSCVAKVLYRYMHFFWLSIPHCEVVPSSPEIQSHKNMEVFLSLINYPSGCSSYQNSASVSRLTVHLGAKEIQYK